VSGLWEEGRSTSGVGDGDLTPGREKFLADIHTNPMLYFWGEDPETGDPIVKTKDTHDDDNPIKALPKWPYLLHLLKRFSQNYRKEIVDKPRQLMVSWMVLLWMDFVCLTKPHRRCLLNKATHQEAEEMLFDRLGIVHQNWPAWFAAWAQVDERKKFATLYYGRTGSSIRCTGENIQDRAARGDQASIAVVDEAARQPYLREIVAALAPMTKQMILVSTPETGSEGSRYMNSILTEGQEVS